MNHPYLKNLFDHNIHIYHNFLHQYPFLHSHMNNLAQILLILNCFQLFYLNFFQDDKLLFIYDSRRLTALSVFLIIVT